MYDGVIVMGMHRSGTSLTSSILEKIGVHLGDRLIEADEHNRAGYFENPGIVRANADLLHHLDRRWTGPKGTLEIPIDTLDPEVMDTVRERITMELSLISSEGRKPWGVKDPRISRLLPLWKEIINILQLRVLFVLCVRHPLEVAESVANRDGLPQEQGQLLWFRHNQDALIETADADIHVVIFERWFTDLECQARQLMEAIGFDGKLNTNQVLADLKSIIRPDLRHQRDHKLEFLPYVETLYTMLIEAAKTGSVPPQTWSLLQEVEKSEILFSNWKNIIREQVTDPRLEAEELTDGQGRIGRFLSRLVSN